MTVSSPFAAENLPSLRLVGHAEFCSFLRMRGDMVFELAEWTGSLPLPPLQFLSASHGLVQTSNDLNFIAKEQVAAVRTFPSAAFDCSNLVVLRSGVSSIDDTICSSSMRTGKFLRAAGEEPRGNLNIFNGQGSTLPPLIFGPTDEINYSHWILEAIPKIARFKTIYKEDPHDIIVSGGKNIFQEQTIAYFCPSARVHWVQPHVPIRFHRACFTTSLARSVSEIHPEVFDFYNLPGQGGPQRQGGLRIYISRRLTQHRRMLNEDEFVAELSRLGFVVVVLESLSFAAQVDLFSNAEVVVGAHGAGLTNLVFSRNCKLAVEILSSGFNAASVYAHICRHLRIPYLLASGAPRQAANAKGAATWAGHRDFVVDVPIFIKAIKGLLRQSAE